MKTGLLRDVSRGAGKEQRIGKSTFSVTQMRRNDSRMGSDKLAHLKIVSDAGHSAAVTIPEASMFKEYSDVVVQAILYEDKLTDFAGYSPLVLDVEMYQARNNAGKTQIAPLKVSDLD